MHQNKQSVEVAKGEKRMTGWLTYGEGAEPDATPYSLMLEVDGERFESASDDLFDRLLAVRRHLEERAMKICVTGAAS